MPNAKLGARKLLAAHPVKRKIHSVGGGLVMFALGQKQTSHPI